MLLHVFFSITDFFLDLFIINHNLPNSVQCFIKFGLCATLPKTYLPEFYHAAKGTNFHFCIHVCHSRTLLATIFFILTSENSNIMSVWGRMTHHCLWHGEQYTVCEECQHLVVIQVNSKGDWYQSESWYGGWWGSEIGIIERKYCREGLFCVGSLAL